MFRVAFTILGYALARSLVRGVGFAFKTEGWMLVIRKGGGVHFLVNIRGCWCVSRSRIGVWSGMIGRWISIHSRSFGTYFGVIFTGESKQRRSRPGL